MSSFRSGPDRLGLAASVSLHAGESEPLRLKIRAKPGARQSTRLIVKAISADAYLRHEIEVALPPAETLELTVEGIARLLDALGIPRCSFIRSRIGRRPIDSVW